MRKILTMTLATALTTGAALVALTAPGWAQDADGDGNVSMEELQAAYPDVTAEMFAGMDTDGDGVLGAAEMQAAMEAGQLPS